MYVDKRNKIDRKHADKKEHMLSNLQDANLVSVQNKIVFVKNKRNNSFHGKINVENLSSKYVTYAVRTSNDEKFHLYPKTGSVHPRKTVEITISTQSVIKEFHEISKEYFCVFVIPIYDKRQLESRKLDILWRAHGTDIFPIKSTEAHKIPFVIPKSDSYNSNHCILERISFGSYLGRPKYYKLMLDHSSEPIDEETFYLHWPIEGKISNDDHNLDYILSEWHTLAKKIHAQSNGIVESWKLLMAVFFTTLATVAYIPCMYFYNNLPFDSTRNKVGFGVNDPEKNPESTHVLFRLFQRTQANKVEHLEHLENENSCVIS